MDRARSEGQGKHRWKFFRVGGVQQVAFRDGQDIIHLEELDQKLWVALACPAKFLEFDSRTLELLDTDKDGRIRAPEILQAVAWVREIFRDPNDLLKGGDTVPFSAINEASPAGASLLVTARRILASLGKADATAITLSDVSDTAKIFATTRFNGDGIVPPESVADENLKKAIVDMMITQGSTLDRSGKAGIDQPRVDSFFQQASAILAWHKAAQETPEVMPVGEKTPQSFAAYAAVRNKIDDFFTRCRLAAFDQRATAALNRAEAEFLALGALDLSLNKDEVARLPLARIEAGRTLPWDDWLNPAWADAIAEFRKETAAPLLGETEGLSEKDWAFIKTKLAPFEKWSAEKPPGTVIGLPVARLAEITAAGTREKILALIQEDLSNQVAADQITALEKLVRIQRDLFRLLNNFVSFSDFYARRGAIFQAGTLYLDARSCELCVHVADPSKHAALAGLARAYLAYCDCTRPGGEKMTIAAAFTAGDSDHLMVGRNGVFYDRKGRDWDATITKIIDNPISIRQAFFAPYKKFVRLVEEQVAKRAAAAETAANAQLGEVATHVASLSITPPQKPGPKKIDVGTVAALGVALGSFATFLGVVVTKFVELRWWAPFALIGVMLAISGPSILIAWLKLRQRNLGPILDANGWAVNGRMKINVPFGGALSKTPSLPPGSEVQLADPFGETHSLRNTILVLVVVFLLTIIAWRLGFLNPILAPQLQYRAATSTNTVIIVTNTVPPSTNTVTPAKP